MPTDLSQEIGKRFRTMAEMNKAYILCALRTARGDKVLAARLLGIGRSTIYKQIGRLSLDEYIRMKKQWGRP